MVIMPPKLAGRAGSPLMYPLVGFSSTEMPYLIRNDFPLVRPPSGKEVYK
jgi:hypothetical protein